MIFTKTFSVHHMSNKALLFILSNTVQKTAKVNSKASLLKSLHIIPLNPERIVFRPILTPTLGTISCDRYWGYGFEHSSGDFVSFI